MRNDQQFTSTSTEEIILGAINNMDKEWKGAASPWRFFEVYDFRNSSSIIVPSTLGAESFLAGGDVEMEATRLHRAVATWSSAVTKNHSVLPIRSPRRRNVIILPGPGVPMRSCCATPGCTSPEAPCAGGSDRFQKAE
jgi:hypothetical protein